jgi:serine protease
VNNSNTLFVQNLITGNQAAAGGGIYWIAADSQGSILVNNTIANNDATDGSGVFANGFGVRTELTNNIIVAKPGRSALHCGPFVTEQPIIRFSNIFSAGGMAYGGNCSDMTGRDGNISADPLFTNPAQGDYHLQQGSPSIDAGDNQAPNLPDTDIDGDHRILDGDGNGTEIIDMGVDEFLAPPSFGISLQLDRRSRMKPEPHVRFCEGVGVKFPRATRLFVGRITAGYQFTSKAIK